MTDWNIDTLGTPEYFIIHEKIFKCSSDGAILCNKGHLISIPGQFTIDELTAESPTRSNSLAKPDSGVNYIIF